MLLFLIEMVIITAWTKAVSDTKVVASGVITFINVMIWSYVVQTIAQDVSNSYRQSIVYSLGCTARRNERVRKKLRVHPQEYLGRDL
jgi:hypothetical protein